jgi:ornithine lipid ester-linked acyl 2-hydroxylase
MIVLQTSYPTMKYSNSGQPNQPSFWEAVRRGWDWVVFVAKNLTRVGGITAWFKALQKMISILQSRSITQNFWAATSRLAASRPSFYDAAEFAFAQHLEANWQKIQQELTALKGEHFIDWSERYLYKEGWQTCGLYAYGVKIEKNCRLCPQTTQLLEQIPNLLTAGFSALAPGTHIAPHTGYPDDVLRCHLGLVIPDDCGIRVGDTTRTWQEGKCLIFDDTLEHEAWNKSDRPRVILLLDFKPTV